VRIYQLKDRKLFDVAWYGGLVKRHDRARAEFAGEHGGRRESGGAANFSRPMVKGTGCVAIAASYQNPDKTGTWKQVIKSKSLSADEPLKLALAGGQLNLPEESAKSNKK
jgi:type VI secretion system protein VasD